MTTVRSGVVLCGGLGTRLAGVVGDRPKALAPVAGRPFLEWLLVDLRRQGITDLVLATGHLGEMLEEEFGTGDRLGLTIRYSREPTGGLGTAGAARLALSRATGDPLVVLNGDSYCGARPADLIAEHLRTGARATIGVVEVADAARFGAVTVRSDGEVARFLEKGAGGGGWISAGTYVIDRDVLDALPPGQAVSLENDVFPSLIGAGLHALRVGGPFVDIGTPDSYRSAAVVMKNLIGDASRPSAAEQTETARRHLELAAAVAVQVAERCIPDMVRAARVIADSFATGGTVLLCGNGGSAADAQHVAAEFVSRLRKEVERRALPALALTTDTSFLSAYANDYDWDGVFARQVEAFGKEGDVLVAISTSGNSPNVVRAVETARTRGLHTVALVGQGGTLIGLCDIAVVVPSTNTGAIQESMLAVEHTICELVEDALFGRPALRDDGVA